MHRSGSRLPTAARITGWGMVAVAYTATLVFAANLSAGEPGAAAAFNRVGEASQAVAGVLAAPQPDVGVTLTSATTHALEVEAPLLTLVIAVAIILAAFAGYAVHGVRARGPRVRSARAIVRYITTLI